MTEKRKLDPQPSFFQQAIVWLYNLLVLTVPLFFTFNTDELFEFNKMVLVYGLTILIVTLWIARMIFEKRWIWKRSWLDYLIGIFLVTQLISTIFSIHPYTSLWGYYSRFHGGLASLITYALLYWAAVANLHRRDLRPLLLSATLSASIVSIYAIAEHFGHSFSCFLVSKGSATGVDCWVQDVQNRVFATFGQPNWLAAYDLMLLAIVVGSLLSRWPKRWERVIYLVSYFLLFWSLLYTRSRSGMLGLVLAAGVVAVAYLYAQFRANQDKKVVNQSRRHCLLWPGIVVGGSLLVVLVSGTPFTPSMSSLIQRSQSSDHNQTTVAASDSATAAPVNRLEIGGTDSGEIRKIVWTGAIDVWKRYPWFGSGVETFAYSYYQDRPIAHNMVSEWDFLYNKAHNEFLNFLATTGAVGLAAYLLLLGGFGIMAVRTFVRLVSQGQTDRALMVASCLAAVSGLAVSNFFGFSTVMVTVLQYLCFAGVILLGEEDRPLSKVPEEISIGRLILIVAVFVLAMFPLKSLYGYYRADQLYANGKAALSQGDVQTALSSLLAAIDRNPREPLYHDELAQLYAQVAVSYAQAKADPKLVTDLVNEATKASNTTMQLNDRQLNFYKTRARTYIILSQIDPAFLDEAVWTLDAAIKLSPTDPKLYYNSGVLKLDRGRTEEGRQDLQKAVELKPDFASAITELETAGAATATPADTSTNSSQPKKQ